jgi:mannose-6-phosphate isomerase-like protein (cupin superfamily)
VPADRPAQLFDIRTTTAYRISDGDTVKLAPLHLPDDLYDCSVFLEIWEPGGSQPPNSHPGSVETFFFLRGEGVAHCDGVTTAVRAGTFLVLPPQSLHRIENTGAGELYAITTMSPDAGFAALVRSGGAEALSADDLAVLERARPERRTDLSRGR